METLTKTYYEADSVRVEKHYEPRTRNHDIRVLEFENPASNLDEGELSHGFAIYDSGSDWQPSASETLDQALEKLAWKVGSEGWLGSQEVANRQSFLQALRRNSSTVRRLRRLPTSGGHKLLGCDARTLNRYIRGLEDVPVAIAARLDFIPRELRGETTPPPEAAAWVNKLRGSDGRIHPDTRIHRALLKIIKGGL